MMLDESGNPHPPEIEEVIRACDAEIERLKAERDAKKCYNVPRRTPQGDTNMKTTINVHTTHMVNGVKIDCGYADEFATVEEAQSHIGDFMARHNDEGYSCEVVRVCDDPKSPDYGKIVEVL